MGGSGVELVDSNMVEVTSNKSKWACSPGAIRLALRVKSSSIDLILENSNKNRCDKLGVEGAFQA